MHRPPSLPVAAVFLALGLGLGWWLRGAWQAPADSEGPPPARQLASDTELSNPGPKPERAPAPTVSPPPDETPANATERLRDLLDREAFQRAVDLYQSEHRVDRDAARRLRGIIVERLEHYLQRREDGALTALAEAFLSVHYDDIDVLLLLARHQRRSGYWTEAARTFQLAHAYSAARPGQREQVERAFARFVEQVDEQQSEGDQWQSLLGFYETLVQMDLDRAADRLRLGELHRRHGDRAYGRSLLESLAGHPALGERASAALERGGSDSSPSGEAAPVDRVPLTARGSHYQLSLGLGDTEATLLIDTGASLTTLTRSAFERLRERASFTELGPQLFNTAGGSTRGMVYRVDSVRLGRHRLVGAPVAVLDFETPAGVDGLLGMNILSRFRFEVDQDEQRLQLQPR